MARIGLVALALAALGCHSGGTCEISLPQGSFVAEGTIGGAPVHVGDVISGSEGAPNLASTQIVVSPTSCLCDVAKGSYGSGAPTKVHDSLLWITVGESCPTSAFCVQEPSAPGSFFVQPPSGGTHVAAAGFDRCDGGTETSIEATSGQVDVASVDASGIRGSFDLTFARGERLTGSFDAPRCGAMGYHYGVSVACP